jgi:hypothetical protein
MPSKKGVKLTAHGGARDYAMRVQPTEDGRFVLRSTRGNMPRLAEIMAGQVGELVIAGGDGPSLFTALGAVSSSSRRPAHWV